MAHLGNPDLCSPDLKKKMHFCSSQLCQRFSWCCSLKTFPLGRAHGAKKLHRRAGLDFPFSNSFTVKLFEAVTRKHWCHKGFIKQGDQDVNMKLFQRSSRVSL